jgi:hypothetical protein
MSTHFDKGYALIIGVANYPHSDIPKLPEKVLKDAKDMYELLISAEYCGYLEANTRKLLDGKATAENIRDDLQWLAKSAGSDSTVVIFFSGHGGQIKHGDAAGNYLLAYDCDPKDMGKTSISGEEFTKLLQAIKADRVIVFFDSCHSGGVGETKNLVLDKIVLKLGLQENYYEQLAQGKGRVIISSSDSDELSRLLPGMANSLFTHYLLEALKGKGSHKGDGLIRVFDVFRYVSDNVPEAACQKPILIAPNTYDNSQNPVMKTHIKNDFPISLFLGGTKTASKPVAPTHSESSFVTKSDILQFLYQVYRDDPDEWVVSEQIQQELGVDQEQLQDFILALREKGFLEAKFLGDKALLRITADGVAIMK